MPNPTSLNQDKLQKMVSIYLSEGKDEVLKQFSLSEETFNRYMREARRRGINTTDRGKIISQIVQNYTDKELEAIAKGGRIVPGYGKVPIISFEGARIRIGAMTDTHIGSNKMSPERIYQAFEEFKREKVDFIVHAGDVTEGMSNRPGHVYELTNIGYSNQKNAAVEIFKQWSDTDVFAISGNHDEWFLKSNGAKIVEDMSKEIDNFHFIGHGEGDISLNGKATLKLWHGEDGNSYALSYRLQKILECVPLDSEILTKHGWKKYNEIHVGDDVMGYNIETKKCEWTKILKINYYSNADVVTYKNNNFKVRCTRNHKWVMSIEARAGANKNCINPKPYNKLSEDLFTIDDLMNDWRRGRILQAAPCPDGDGLQILDHLDWINRSNAENNVLKMTSLQRKSFILGMLYGEGSLMKSSIDKNPNRRGSVVFHQNPGVVDNAFRLACFMEGISLGTIGKTRKKINGEDRVCNTSTLLVKPYRMVSSMKQTESSIEDVWCPTTELNTWVMRQNNVITITGNSLTGGEKPNAMLCGHTHKYVDIFERHVFCTSIGCMQSQTPWMRGKRIAAHTGFAIIDYWVNDKGICKKTSTWHPFYS